MQLAGGIERAEVRVVMRIGNRDFEIRNHTYIMGILNVTPDSFSDGGNYNQIDTALFHVEEMLRDGADIIDIGGESTKPGYVQISVEEEIERVVPAIEQIKKRFDVPISLDTYKAEVAEAGIKAGADLINDIWGLKGDDRMAEIIAKAGVPCCLMHNRKEAVYQDYIQDVLADLEESLELARKAGIERDRIILDPGIGFAKTYEQNLVLLQQLEALHSFGCPILLGTSRKSVIGLTLDVPADERLIGTVATTVMGAMKGCSFVRVHDIKENVQAIKMTEAILHAEI